MDRNIDNYIWNGCEFDIYINTNTYTNDNLYQHLIEIEKLSPSTWASTTSILHTKASSQRKRKYWERALMVASRTKGCRIKHIRIGHILAIIYLLSKFLLLQCFIVAQYISPQWEVKGWIRPFPNIWKDKDQVIRYLMGKNPNIFIFWEYNPMYVGDSGARCV